MPIICLHPHVDSHVYMESRGSIIRITINKSTQITKYQAKKKKKKKKKKEKKKTRRNKENATENYDSEAHNLIAKHTHKYIYTHIHIQR